MCCLLIDCAVGWRLLKYWALEDCPIDYYSFETEDGITLHADGDDTSGMIVDGDIVSRYQLYLSVP